MIQALGTRRRLPSGEIVPLDPIFIRWFERVNNGARFQLNHHDELSGPQGEPYLRLPLIPESEDETTTEGYTFAELALFLYNRSTGAILVHPENDINHPDRLEVSLGDVIDFLQNGVLQDRVPATPPWGYPGDSFADFTGPLYEPDMILLPQVLRRNLVWLFQRIGAVGSCVALTEGKNGLRCFLFVYKTEQPLTDDLYKSVAERIYWYLPRHYAVVVFPADNMVGYPILPEQD